MSAPPAPTPRLTASTVLLAALLSLLGLLGGIPLFVGPIVAVVGVVLSGTLRGRAGRTTPGVELVPALTALAILTFAAPVAASTELVAGASSLGLLLWLADDPARRPGTALRAIPTIALAALAFGLGWSLTLAVSIPSADVGLAGALIAVALVVVAVVLLRASEAIGAETA